jgi:hypothetical protein
MTQETNSLVSCSEFAHFSCSKPKGLLLFTKAHSTGPNNISKHLCFVRKICLRTSCRSLKLLWHWGTLSLPFSIWGRAVALWTGHNYALCMVYFDEYWVVRFKNLWMHMFVVNEGCRMVHQNSQKIRVHVQFYNTCSDRFSYSYPKWSGVQNELNWLLGKGNLFIYWRVMFPYPTRLTESQWIACRLQYSCSACTV